MKFWRNFKLRRLYKYIGFHPKWRYDREERSWLADQWEQDGFRSYIYVRDIKIMKGIAKCIENRDFQTALEYNGRRLELLRISAKAKKEWEIRKKLNK